MLENLVAILIYLIHLISVISVMLHMRMSIIYYAQQMCVTYKNLCKKNYTKYKLININSIIWNIN